MLFALIRTFLKILLWLGEDRGFATESMEMINKVNGYLYSELSKTVGDMFDFSVFEIEDQDIFSARWSRWSRYLASDNSEGVASWMGTSAVILWTAVVQKNLSSTRNPAFASSDVC